MAERASTGGSTARAFAAMNAAVLSIAAQRRLEDVLQQLVEAARELTNARYAAIGVPDGEGGFASFITSGMTDAQLEALGELPRTHGLLGAMLEQPEPYRTDDIRSDPRFEGWPEAHPIMRAFMGVPILAGDEVLGAFYITEKRDRPQGTFTDADQDLIETLAPHAAVAIENARHFERSRELSVIEERNRLARELHDSVTQTMASAAVMADAALKLLDHDPARAREHVESVGRLARDALVELRSLVFELRPAALEQDGLAPAIRKHADVLERVHGVEIAVEVDCPEHLDPATEQALFRIAQEALANAVKHAGPDRVRVSLTSADGTLELCVEDDGRGFEPSVTRARSGKLGLTSMAERAERLGGALRIESTPGGGTTVSVVLRRVRGR
jgi:signal transduction histidine kinase